MNLKEWCDTVDRELTARGFSVRRIDGFPVVACPADFKKTLELIRCQLSLPVEKRIYAEGMLFIPAGLDVRGMGVGSKVEPK